MYIYVFWKFLNENNLFRLCFLIMFFILISSFYLGFLQLELFACFLFISEFIILIFFFCFFFKINVPNKIIFNKNLKLLSYLIVFSILVIITLISLYFIVSYNVADDCFLAFFNFYKLYNTFIMNDFAFFFYSFFQYYLILYFLIGIFLLFMTTYLLYVIWVYIYLQHVRFFYVNGLTLATKTNKEWRQIRVNFFNFKG